MNVQLPDAESLSVSIGEARVAAPDNSAAVAPISVPTSSGVSVSVSFSDGTSRDFTTDDRTEIIVAPIHQSCATYDAGVLTVLAGATCDSIRITVSIPAFGLSGSATVPLVSFVSLQLTMNPFPTFSGSASGTMSTLRLIDCTDVRQLAIARVVGTLSDGATTVLTTADSTTVAIDEAQSSATASLARSRTNRAASR